MERLGFGTLFVELEKMGKRMGKWNLVEASVYDKTRPGRAKNWIKTRGLVVVIVSRLAVWQSPTGVGIRRNTIMDGLFDDDCDTAVVTSKKSTSQSGRVTKRKRCSGSQSSKTKGQIQCRRVQSHPTR